jgi:2-hydroxychromene-2-carboxylate isomerase
VTDQITIFYDYTCPYTYRVHRWMQMLQRSDRTLAIAWKPLLLREINRAPDEASWFEGADNDGVALLALELAKATQALSAASFAQYHNVTYDAMQGADRRRVTPDELREIAASAGLDIQQFERERGDGVWRAQVGADHRGGVDRWNAFGTPTLVFDDAAAMFLKFTAVPSNPDDAIRLYDALRYIALQHGELIEIKVP